MAVQDEYRIFGMLLRSLDSSGIFQISCPVKILYWTILSSSLSLSLDVVRQAGETCKMSPILPTGWVFRQIPAVVVAVPTGASMLSAPPVGGSTADETPEDFP